MNYVEELLKEHYEWKGKIKVITDIPVKTPEDLSLAYTPGVAQPCLEIQKDVNESYELTRRWNLCAVVMNGTAVLGPGDIGPEAGIPVMKGKCVLFKALGDVDAFSFCIKSKDVDEIANIIYLLSGSFNNVNLEDIAAPRCFEIERKLKGKCDTPIFHDDQHGAVTVVFSGLINALKVVGRDKEKVKVVVNGLGSVGIAVSKLLLSHGFKNLTLCNREGITIENSKGLNWTQKEMFGVMNLDYKIGTLKDALADADIFLGLSGPSMVTEKMVRSTSKDMIIFVCANPTPEIFPNEAKKGDTKIIPTGRLDLPNQINNVFAFPGLLHGVFDIRVKDINKKMKMTAVVTIANLISNDEVNGNNIIPKIFDPCVKGVATKAVAKAARHTGVAKT